MTIGVMVIGSDETEELYARLLSCVRSSVGVYICSLGGKLAFRFEMALNSNWFLVLRLDLLELCRRQLRRVHRQ